MRDASRSGRVRRRGADGAAYALGLASEVALVLVMGLIALLIAVAARVLAG